MTAGSYLHGALNMQTAMATERFPQGRCTQKRSTKLAHRRNVPTMLDSKFTTKTYIHSKVLAVMQKDICKTVASPAYSCGPDEFINRIVRNLPPLLLLDRQDE